MKRKMQFKKKSNPDLRCDLCNRAFTCDLNYSRHMRKMHAQKVTKFKCERCGMVFLKECWLQEHQCTGTVEKLHFTCNVCSKNFLHKRSLQRHQLRVHQTETIINCNICKKRFDDNEQLISHRHNCIPKPSVRKVKGSGTVECTLCSAKLQNNTYLRIHMRRQHDPSTKKFKCPQCRAVFMHETSLEKHDCPNSQSYRCRDCGKQLSNLKTFRMHQIRFHSSNTIFCTICSRLFTVADDRDKHQLKCDLQRKMSYFKTYGRFECDICKFVSNRKSKLRAHMLAKHNPDADKLKCQICKRFYLSELALHEHRCMGKSTIDTKSLCNICGIILANPRILSRHKVSMHSSPGTIFCRTCVKKFKTVEELNAHKPECRMKRKLQKQNKLAQNNPETSLY